MFWPILIGICLLIYFVMQWYLINRNKIETVKATEGYINDSIMTIGIVCRNEYIMGETEGGYCYYDVNNGDRVSKGMLIGETYNSMEDISLIYQAQGLSQQIQNLLSGSNSVHSNGQVNVGNLFSIASALMGQ